MKTTERERGATNGSLVKEHTGHRQSWVSLNRQRRPSHPPFSPPPDPRMRQGSIIRRKRDMTPSHQPLPRAVPHVSYRNLITLANVGRLTPVRRGESVARNIIANGVPHRVAGLVDLIPSAIRHPPPTTHRVTAGTRQQAWHGVGGDVRGRAVGTVPHLGSKHPQRPCNQVEIVPEKPTRREELTDGPSRSVPVS